MWTKLINLSLGLIKFDLISNNLIMKINRVNLSLLLTWEYLNWIWFEIK
jgi:hypothetical protein